MNKICDEKAIGNVIVALLEAQTALSEFPHCSSQWGTNVRNQPWPINFPNNILAYAFSGADINGYLGVRVLSASMNSTGQVQASLAAGPGFNVYDKIPCIIAIGY